MEAKDFSTLKKTLRIIQKKQASANVASFWIVIRRFEGKITAVEVTIFKERKDTHESFCFYSFHDKEKRFACYNRMMDYINEE